MSDFRRVNDSITVSPQVAEADMARAAAEGFVLVINNRPDGEDPSQPPGAAIEAAARAAGMDYLHVPVRGGPTPEQVETVRAAVEAAQGPVLAFCRSGTRSTSAPARMASASRSSTSGCRSFPACSRPSSAG